MPQIDGMPFFPQFIWFLVILQIYTLLFGNM